MWPWWPPPGNGPEARLSAPEGGQTPGPFAGDQRLGTGAEVRVVNAARKIAQGIGRIVNAVETALEPRHTKLLLQLAGPVEHGS